MGSNRRNVALHGVASPARRRRVVPAGRPRPRHARRAHAMAPRREIARRLRRSRRPGARHRRPYPSDDERPRSDNRRDRRGHAAVSAVLRRPALRAGRAVAPLRGGRRCGAGSRVRAGIVRPGNPGDRHLPVQPVPERRSNPRSARRPRSARECRRAGDCRIADHRRPGGQGAHRQDHGGARYRGQHRRRGGALSRVDRRAGAGRGGRGRCRRRRCAGARDAHADDRPRGSRTAGARGGRVRGHVVR